MTAPVKEELETGTEDADGDAGEGAEDIAGADQLGDAGQKALDHLKQQRNKFRTELNAYKNLGLSADDLQALISKSKDDAAKADQQRVRQEAEGAALAKANERLVRAEIKAAATGKLANPALALKLLDLSEFEVNDDGEVDSDMVAKAIDDLIKKEPYLSAQGGKPRFEGTADAGAKGNAGKPQMSKEEMQRLYKAGKHEEIEAARKAGQLNDLLGIKS